MFGLIKWERKESEENLFRKVSHHPRRLKYKNKVVRERKNKIVIYNIITGYAGFVMEQVSTTAFRGGRPQSLSVRRPRPSFLESRSGVSSSLFISTPPIQLRGLRSSKILQHSLLLWGPLRYPPLLAFLPPRCYCRFFFPWYRQNLFFLLPCTFLLSSSML